MGRIRNNKAHGLTLDVDTARSYGQQQELLSGSSSNSSGSAKKAQKRKHSPSSVVNKKMKTSANVSYIFLFITCITIVLYIFHL